MNDYYFTFGQSHKDKSGHRLKNSWVRVTAESWDKAREIFINQFAKVELSSYDKWSMEYESAKFNPIKYLYPDGELRHLSQNIKELTRDYTKNNLDEL